MEETGPQTRITYDEVDDWIKDAIRDHGPEGIKVDDSATIDFKMTKLRGKTDSYAITMLFHIDFQDEVFFVAMDWNRKTFNHKCSLAEWRERLAEFNPPKQN
jgi:hypothetical protein